MQRFGKIYQPSVSLVAKIFPISLLVFAAFGRTASNEYFVYVGTYADGIYGYRYDSRNFKLQSMGLVGSVENPSFLIIHPNHHFLYAVSELTGNDNPVGRVVSFSIDQKTGKLTRLNDVSSEGTSPCHLALDRTGKMLMVANYGTGSVAVFPILPDGRIGKMTGLMTASGSSVNKERQAGPHAHEVVVSSDNKLAFVPDLGLDEIRMYEMHPKTATLTPATPAFARVPPGSGPRHVVFSSGERYAYVANELGSTVTVFSYNRAAHALTLIQTASPVSADFHGTNYPAEVTLDRSGDHLYVSNRGNDSAAVFQVDRSSGKLSQIQVESAKGSWPRFLTIDPTGKRLFVANQKSNNIVIFGIDPSSGRISATGEPIELSTPVCIQFLAAK